MARPKKLYLGGKLLVVPHPFEEEVEWLVRTNHNLLCETITSIEQGEVSALSKQEADPQELGGEIAYAKSNADELRREANSFALVSLVTRLQHWVKVFVEELTNKGAENTSLVKNLGILKGRFGDGPMPVAFFEDLETVRDSIIHADSKAEWTYCKARRVPEQYRDVSLEEVDFTDAHLREAIEKSIAQIKWYDNQLDALEAATTN